MVVGRKRWVWISLMAAGGLVGALGVVFVVLGLDRADQLASVVGVFVGLAGLGVSVYGVVLARRTGSPDPPSSAAAPAPAAGGETIIATGERSVAVRDNSGVIQTGDDSTAQR